MTSKKQQTPDNQLSLFDYKPRQEDAETAIGDFSSVRTDFVNDVMVYSILDTIGILMDKDSQASSVYWRKLKQRLNQEGSELVTKCHTLKMIATDGKRRDTDVMARVDILRLLQSIPSPKAEPFKLWLANEGNRALQRQEDAETAIGDAMDAVDYHLGKYRKQGKSDQWISERVESIVDRKRFTDALHNAVFDITPNFYAETTEMVYKGIWDRTTAQLRSDLDITKKDNPRDHFGTYALAYTRLAEMVCSQLLEQAETVSMVMACDVIWKVAKMVKGQAEETAKLLNVDLVTGQKLLKSHYDYE